MASLESETETFSVEGPDLWEWYVTHLREWVARESIRSPTDDTCVVVAEVCRDYL